MSLSVVARNFIDQFDENSEDIKDSKIEYEIENFMKGKILDDEIITLYKDFEDIDYDDNEIVFTGLSLWNKYIEDISENSEKILKIEVSCNDIFIDKSFIYPENTEVILKPGTYEVDVN